MHCNSGFTLVTFLWTLGYNLPTVRETAKRTFTASISFSEIHPVKRLGHTKKYVLILFYKINVILNLAHVFPNMKYFQTYGEINIRCEPNIKNLKTWNKCQDLGEYSRNYKMTFLNVVGIFIFTLMLVYISVCI